jgi:hypothetical protein
MIKNRRQLHGLCDILDISKLETRQANTKRAFKKMQLIKYFVSPKD